MLKEKELAKILFVPPNSREIAQFVLIKPELERLGGEVTTIALNTKMETLLEQAGLRFERFKDYRSINMLDIVDEEKPDLVLTNPIGSFPVLDAFAIASNYRGIPCLQIYNGMVISSNAVVERIPLRKPLQKFIKRAVRTITSASNVRSVLYFMATLKATSSIFRNLKILPSEILRLTFPIGRSFRYREGANMVVHSHPAKDDFINLGWPPERVFVVGQPRLDSIFRKDFDKDKFLSTLDISRYKNIVLLATQPLLSFWSWKDHKEFIAAIVTAIDNFPDEELVIKLHPEESLEDYQEILKELDRESIRLYKDIDIYDLINACNLLMTTHSTTALEAMILDKPVLCIDFTGRCPISIYTDDEAAIGIHRQADLTSAIDKALHDPQTGQELEQGRKRFLSKNIYKPDGQTSKRVAELIIRLVREYKMDTTTT